MKPVPPPLALPNPHCLLSATVDPNLPRHKLMEEPVHIGAIGDSFEVFLA